MDPSQGMENGDAGYRAFFETAPIGMIRFSSEGRILLMNKKAMAILGYSDSCADHSNISDFFVDLNDAKSLNTYLKNNDPFFLMDCEWSRFDRQHFHVSFKCSRTADPQNQTICHNAIVEDVTEPKKMEEEHKLEHQLLNSFINNLPDHIYFKDKQSRFIRINQSLAVHFKLKNPVLAAGLSDFDFFSKEHAQQAYDDEQEIIRTGKCISKEEIETWPDGHITWVLTTKMPLKNGADEITGTFGISREITDRKLAEENLSRERDLLQTLIDSLPDLIYIKNRKSRFIRINQAMAANYGIPSPHEAIGKREQDYLPKDSAEESLNDEIHIIKTGIALVNKLEMDKRPGAEGRWLSTTKVPIYEKDGNIFGIVGMTRDITDFMSAKEKLYESKEQIQTIFETSNDSVLLLDREGIIDCNEATLKMFRIRQKDGIIGLHLSRLSHDIRIDGKSSQELLVEKIDSAFKHGTLHFEWLFVKTTGEIFPGEITLTVFPKIGKKLLLAIIHDISKRMQAAEEVQRYLDIFANIEVGMIVYRLEDIQDDRTLRMMVMNPFAERTTGRPADHCVGKTIDEIFPKMRTKNIPQLLAQVVRDKKAVEPKEMNFEDGELRNQWFFIKLFSLPNQCVGVSFEDITARKTLESQLHLAQKLESIGQLSSGIAHEINTPTQYVSDNTRFLKDSFHDIDPLLRKLSVLLEAEKSGKDRTALVDELENEINRMDLSYLVSEIPKAIDQSLEGLDRVSKIVRAMKEFSHPGSTEKISTNINKAIETTVTVSKNEWKYVSDVETDFDPELPNVTCYCDELNQVILNLITNAAHAIGESNSVTEGRKGIIRIKTKKIGDKIEIRIRDTGVGIPKAIQSKVFDPFFTTKEVGKGTGQGLALAHLIVVEKHGGNICFETEEGKGTEFIIQLPIE